MQISTLRLGFKLAFNQTAYGLLWGMFANHLEWNRVNKELNWSQLSFHIFTWVVSSWQWCNLIWAICTYMRAFKDRLTCQLQGTDLCVSHALTSELCSGLSWSILFSRVAHNDKLYQRHFWINPRKNRDAAERNCGASNAPLMLSTKNRENVYSALNQKYSKAIKIV